MERPTNDRRPLVGVGVIVRKGKDVLLIKRAFAHGAGTWSTPGGHLDFGESPEQCAVREAMEETGVVVDDVSFIGITNDLFSAEQKHYITLWMDSVYRSGEVRINAEYEMTDVGWFPWDEFPEPLFLPLRNLLTGNHYAKIMFRR